MDEFDAKNAMHARFKDVQARMARAAERSGRSSECVKLIAVSKFQPEEAIRMALACGQTVFGENYVQEALAKQVSFAAQPASAGGGIEWHYIGHAQTNKAKDIAGKFALIHTIDSIRLAEGVSRRLAPEMEQDVLLQVNVGHEAQKAGVDEAELPRLAEAVNALPGIHLRGLMCLPPFFDDGEAARPYFARLRELRDSLATQMGIALPELSMGMSGDFEQAIEEGATLIRVGTTLFGARPTK